MKKKGGFATYKRRGEWVELIFMMRAAELEFNVSKPWGDFLGLTVHLNQVVLNITAVQGAGNLLGNLLCAVANLLNGSNLSGV